jgi:hypothetical protein
MRRSVACFSLSLASFSASTLAGADPLTLNTRSLVVFDTEGDFFRLAGSAFDLDQPGRDESGERFFIPKTFDFSCNPCRPGQVLAISVNTDAEVDLGHARGVIDNVEFSSLALVGSFAFRTEPVVFPDPSEEAVFVNAPFMFTGFVRAFAGDIEVFRHALRGNGNEFAQFVRKDDNRFSLPEGPIIFQFDSETPATPEPSTVLLVGGGTLALACGRTRRIRPCERQPPGDRGDHAPVFHGLSGPAS